MWWLAALTACAPPDLPDTCEQTPQGEVTLPADDAQHAEPVEWWYWTGHLRDDDGRRYGFEQAFFAMQLGAYDARSVHVALTDIDGDAFDHHIVYAPGGYGAGPETGFDLALDGQSAAGGDGQDALGAAFGDRGWDLSLTATKAPVLQHGDGFHDYAVGGYTWYYSRERMAIDGTVTVGGEARTVTGEAWFDHQWGDLLSASNAGWDWFAIQLDDDREIMLFLVNGSDEVIGGSLAEPDCTAREIGEEELSVTALGDWTSPETGCTYPMGWDVTVGDLQLHVAPVRDDQEMVNSYKTYWEGAATVSGDATGRAYVELAGYCDDYHGGR